MYPFDRTRGISMGLRFKKSVKIAKGVKVNFGKTGASLTVGTRGLHHTIHTSGKKTSSIGLPGTGLSYVSTSGGGKGKRSQNRSRQNTRSSVSAAQIQREQEVQYAKNCEMVDDYNELIDQIRSIHDECSAPVDWEGLRDAPEPFGFMGVGPNESEAVRAANEAKPSLFGRFIPGADKKREQKLADAISEAREKDQQLYLEWDETRTLAEHVLNGDIDSYFYVISEMHPFEEILDFGSDFDVGTDDPSIMEVEFHAKTSKVVPNHVLSMTKTGGVSSKAMSKTMHFDIAQDYICSCILRIAREMFALLPIERVAIHAVDTVTDASGNESDDTVLSVLIRREQFDGINFDLIDPSDTIETFEHNMNFKKTQGLKPVPRVQF